MEIQIKQTKNKKMKKQISLSFASLNRFIIWNGLHCFLVVDLYQVLKHTYCFFYTCDRTKAVHTTQPKK